MSNDSELATEWLQVLDALRPKLMDEAKAEGLDDVEAERLVETLIDTVAKDLAEQRRA